MPFKRFDPRLGTLEMEAFTNRISKIEKEKNLELDNASKYNLLQLFMQHKDSEIKKILNSK